VIAVIDGYFDRQPSVWHKEILLALSEGVHVFGAASMGALRAAELHGYGMVGVGAVFEAFRDGHLVDDDEVAVIHGPVEQGCPPLSTAMVDLRDLFQRAAAAGRISDDDAATLVAIAKGLPYPERSLHAVAALATGPAGNAVRAVRDFVADAGPGLKERDARDLLDVVADFIRADPAPKKVAWELEWTVFLDDLVSSVEREQAATDGGPASPEEATPRALLQLLAESEARRSGRGPTDADVEQAVAALRRAHGLGSADRMVGWMEETAVDWPDLVEWVRRELITQQIAHAYRFEVAARARSHQRIGRALRDLGEQAP
jgi:hypothetical protein